MTVASVNEDTCRAVLDSGFLDVLFCMYACNFISNTSGASVEGGRKSLLETVCAGLATLSCQPSAQAIILEHPICNLWPTNELLPPLPGDRTSEQLAIWKQLGPDSHTTNSFIGTDFMGANS
jgi:hypothetical protein